MREEQWVQEETVEGEEAREAESGVASLVVASSVARQVTGKVGSDVDWAEAEVGAASLAMVAAVKEASWVARQVPGKVA
jgi:hypothetical protein